MKKRIWSSVAVNNFSYACLIIIYSILDVTKLADPLTSTIALQFFLCTTIISVFQFLVSLLFAKFTELYLPVQALTDILCINLVVFGLGGILFQWFSFQNPLQIVMVLFMNLIIYAVVFVLLTYKSVLDAKQINKAILRAKKQREAQNEL